MKKTSLPTGIQTGHLETPDTLGNQSLSLPAVTLQTSYNRIHFISIYSQSQSSPTSEITLIGVLGVLKLGSVTFTDKLLM